MWPFNRARKPSNAKLPPEVKKYYDSERRERVGLAWLIAFATLMLTILIMVGLFMGGRWTYRKIAGTNPPPAPTISQENKPLPGPPSETKIANSAPVSSPAEPATSSKAPTPSSPQRTVATHSTHTSPSTAQTGTKLIETGPGNTLEIFALTTITATAAHSVYIRRKPARN